MKKRESKEKAARHVNFMVVYWLLDRGESVRSILEVSFFFLLWRTLRQFRVRISSSLISKWPRRPWSRHEGPSKRWTAWAWLIDDKNHQRKSIPSWSTFFMLHHREWFFKTRGIMPLSAWRIPQEESLCQLDIRQGNAKVYLENVSDHIGLLSRPTEMLRI